MIPVNTGTFQIRIMDILRTVLKHRITIIRLTVLGLIAGIVLSAVSYMRGEMSREYSITTSFAIVSTNKSGNYSSSGTGSPGYTDVQLSERIVDSAMYVLKSARTIQTVIDRAGLIGVKPKDITSNLTISQYNETQIVEVRLYWRSGEEGILILQTLNEVANAELINTLEIGGVSVINEPTSTYQVGGNLNAMLWIYMTVLGAIAGVGIAVLELFLRPTLLNQKDVEDQFGLEIIGEVPYRPAAFAEQTSLLMTDPAIPNEIPESFSSAAHILRNRLGPKGKHKCLYVTSATKEEGRTTVAAQLALQLSEMEIKVLLIDLDVRRPSIGRLFMEKVDYEHSLNALYQGDISREDAITSVTGFLDILPAVLEHASIPLDTTIFDLVKSLAEDYDYIIIDSAPVGESANTMNLNQIADTALFVIRLTGP